MSCSQVKSRCGTYFVIRLHVSVESGRGSRSGSFPIFCVTIAKEKPSVQIQHHAFIERDKFN